MEKAIKFFCKQVPNKEWSGIVFYKKVKDVITVKDILFMSIDTEALTEFDWANDPDIIEYIFDRELEDCSMASIHSHHGMTVTPSTTDWEDVGNQTKSFPNGYLFLIVNNAGDLTAIYSKVGKIKTVFESSNLDGKVERVKAEEECVLYSMCYRDNVALIVDKEYQDRYNKIKAVVKVDTTNYQVKKYNPASPPSDKFAKVRGIYWTLASGTYDYNVQLHDPESYLDLYTKKYGKLDNMTCIKVIETVLDYVKTINKTTFVKDLIEDYTLWLQIIDSDTVPQVGQKNYALSSSSDWEELGMD